MVAIITGKGAGIENSSVALLGSRGQLGGSALGRSGENVFLNAATGNLVINDTDEMLVGRGPDAVVSRTYNSLGAWDGDNDDYWRAGVYRRVYGLTGGSGYGTSGSTVKRTEWDGSEVTYSWNANYYCTGVGAYVTTDGAGAYDTLTRSSTTWTWTDGDTQITELYDDNNSGRITARSDTSGNTVSYTYTSGLITRITTSNGEYTDLVYDGAGGLQLQSLVTNTGGSITRTFYEYDTHDRLIKVRVNLAPSDNSSSTGANYDTTYTYDDNPAGVPPTFSQRVASITQSDGTFVSISYAQDTNGVYRVSSITQAVESGQSRTTTFGYDLLNSVTTITDAVGQVTRLTYDTNKNLIKIVTPPVGAEVAPQVMEFAYEGDGDVASVRLGPGNTITYEYDTRGNIILERDSAGNTVTRTYSAKNELLTQTKYLIPDSDGAGSNLPSGAVTDNYIYDALSRLRYAVTSEGRVTEYRYDGFGQQTSAIAYTASTYTSTMTLTALNSWVSGTASRAAAQRTDTWYDFRGNVARTVSYAVLDTYGEGTQDPIAVYAGTNTTVVQQANGLYRVTKTGGVTGNWLADAHSSIKAEGDFILQIKTNDTRGLLIGVSSQAASTSNATLNYGILFDTNGVAYGYDLGTQTMLGSSHVTYADGDTLWMVRTGSTLNYYKGATLAAAVAAGVIRTASGATGTLYLDVKIHDLNASADIGFTPQPIVNGANTTVTQQPDGLTRITKTGGTNGTYDADARGSAAAAADFVLQVRPGQTNAELVAGVSTSPGTNSSTANVTYGLVFSNTGTAYYWLGATSGNGSLGSYSANQSFWIVRTGTTLNYYKGETLEGAIRSGTLHTINGVSSTLYFDSALRAAGSKVDVAFTPGALSSADVTRTDYVYDAAGSLLSRAIAGQGAESFVYDGMGRITASTNFNNVTTTIAFNDTTSSTSVTLANGLVQTSTFNKAGELIAFMEADGSTSLGTTHYGYDGLGRLRYVTDPTDQSRYYFHDAVGRRIAEIDADGSVTEYRYDANNNLTSTTSYANKLSGTQIASLTAEPEASPIANGANTSVVQQLDGLYRVTKTAGSDGWNADARGTLAMTGDFLLQVKPAQDTQPLSSGVSLSPNTSSSYTDVRYGFVLDFGYVYAFEYDAVANTSSQTHLGVTYDPGDNLWMTRVGSTIRWYKGATFEAAQAAGALRTITGANTGTMYFDSSIHTAGSSMDVGLTTLSPGFESVRPATDSTNDRWTFNVYDHAQRLVQTIDGTGSTTVNSYDGASRLTSTRNYAGLVSGSNLATLKARAIAPNAWANPNNASLWDQSGATRTSEGTIDGANAYKFTVNTSGTIVAVRPGASSASVVAGDMVTFTFWVKAGSVNHTGFGIRGSASTWGGTGESVATIVSGPGTLTGATGVQTITGLSTTEATLVRITRTFTQTETVSLIVYPSYPNTNTVAGDSVIVAKPIATFTPASAAYLPTEASDDRVSRLFYDNDGNLIGTLDAEGYLTEIIYDGAGRKIRTIGYSAGTSASGTLPSGKTIDQLRAEGTFTQLKANITPSSTADINNWWVYDARGRVRATIDGEGSLTRFNYTPAGHLLQQVSGQKLTVSTLISTPPTFATLPAAGGSEILSTTSWTRNLFGQALTETRALTGSVTTTTTYSYDNMRRLIATTTQSGGTDPRTYGQRYDKQGRLTSEISGDGYAVIIADPTPTQGEIDQAYIDYGWTYTYDTAGRLTSKTGPKGSASAGAKTLFYYNADDGLAYEINALGEVVEYRYNAFGQRTDIIVYGKRLSSLSGLTGGLIDNTLTTALTGLPDSAIDSVTTTAFNVDGTVKQVTDPLSNVTSLFYNAFGDLTKSSAPLDGADVIETSRTYDRRGLLKTEIVDSESGGKAITTSYGYDAFGRALTLTNALSKTTTSTYDRKGRLITTSQSPDGGTTVYTTTYTYDARDNLVAVKDAQNNITRFVYDKANRQVAAIDALGALTTTSYDADGRVIATRAYKNTVSISTGTLEIAENLAALTTAIANTNAADHVTRYAYDKDGQLRFTVDGLMHVVEHVYDASGNAIRTVAYDGTIGVDGTGAYSSAFIAGQISTLNLANAAGTRITRAVYDAANRLNWSIDAAGQVTRHVYDTKGQVIKQIQFAEKYTASGDPLVGTMDTWVASSPVVALAADDRTTRAYYDRKGQLAFSIDALGYVTRSEYDKLGNVKKQTRYADAYSASDSTTLANMVSDFTSPPSTRRETLFAYDSAGRLESTTDPEGFVTKLTLDAMGQITSSIVDYVVSDPTRGSKTAYTYDDVGRVVKQVNASGETEASTSWFFYDALGQQTASVDGENYLAVWTYDATGNRLTDTRYAGKITGTFTSASSVTALQTLAGTSANDIASSIAYDTFGRATSATDSRGSVVSISYDVLDRITSQTQEMESGSGDDRTTAYVYDNFGNAVKITDPRGNVSYAYYDKLGRVTRQVDAERFVTDTDYNRGSQVANVKRYATALGGGVFVDEATKPAAPSGAVSTTSFVYNKRDELTSTTDAENFTESYTLSAFGERLTYRNKLYVVTTFDTTVTYTYDKRGLLLTETLPVQAEVLAGGGVMGAVVNSYSYDARGNLLQKVEASTSKTSRTTSYSYDKLDRLISTTGDQVTVRKADFTTETVAPTETIKYDKRGNVVETVDASGARTVVWYDAFSRKVAEAHQFQLDGSDAKGSYSVTAYDKAGNVTSVKAYGETVVIPTNGDLPTITQPDNYRLASYTYYRDNRLKETIVASLTTGTWDGTNYVLTPGTVSGSPNSAAEIKTLLEYDKAGNVVHQEDGRGNDTWIWYDKLGREVAKVDAENYLTRWTRDAEGNAIEETRYATALSSFSTGGTPPTQTAHNNDRTTEFSYDKMGRRTEERRLKVAYTSIAANGVATDVLASDSSAVSKVSYTYNGLGQVLTKTEANLADIAVSTTARETTSYAYDKVGRLVTETGQSFTGSTGSTVTPITAFVYDGLNNLISSRVQAASVANDTNDRITTYTYGAGGRLASVTDATTFTRSYDYDRSGRTVMERYTRTKADGSTTVKEAQVTRYDLAGRVVLQTIARDSGTSTPNWGYTSELTGNPAYDATHIRYNAYGEVTGRGITAATSSTPTYQEEFSYDAGGRLWKSNAGDGVLRFYVYDKAGNQTLTLTSAGADLSSLTASNYTASIGSTGDTSTTDAVTTLTVFDKRGQATSTREPDRAISGSSTSNLIIRSRTYNAFGEVLSETDPRGYDASGNAITFTGGAGYTTTFTYNSMGRLLSKVSPQVSIASETGAVSYINPTETYGYDLAGRLVSVMDANANAISIPLDRYRTTRLLLAGTGHDGTDPLVTKEFHADNGVFETKYDIFGDARILRNELYDVLLSNSIDTDLVQTFDKMGRLIQAQQRGNLLTDHYAYDGLGQRIQHWNSQLTSSVKATTDYDAQGRVVSVVQLGGDTTTYAYAWSTSLATAGLGDFDGWVKTTVNTGGVDMTEQTDYFGRAIGKSDYGDAVSTMTFDKGGRLTSLGITPSGSSTTTTSYTWYNTGLQATVTTGAAVSTYRYDAASNRVFEGRVVGSTVYQAASVEWDALNRMTAFDDAGVDGGSNVNIDYWYDANSNVRRILSTYRKLGEDGNVVTSGSPLVQDYYYRYDKMNRFTLTMGKSNGRGHDNETGGVYAGRDITYDLAGNRKSMTWTEQGPGQLEGDIVIHFKYDHQETYFYRADGHLVRTEIASEVETTGALGTPYVAAIYDRDAMGRVTQYQEKSSNGSSVYLRTSTYNNKSQLTRDVVTSWRTDGKFTSENDYYYNAVLNGSGRWDGVMSNSTNTYMGGVVTWIETKNLKNDVDGDSDDTRLVHEYLWRESAQLENSTHDSNTGSGSDTLWDTYYYRDAASNLTGAYIDDGRDRTVTLVNDAEGRVLQRKEDDGLGKVPRELHYYFNGRRVGDISNSGTSNIDYAASIGAHQVPPGSGAVAGAPYADFDQSYDPINGLTYESTGSNYTVQAGDTLASIAQSVWGDASLWYKIAEVNGLSGTEALPAGAILAIPGKVHNVHHNASTWRPYNPNEAIGDLSPTAAKPQKQGGCGTLGAILMVIVAVAVTMVATAGATALISGKGLGAVLGAMVGSTSTAASAAAAAISPMAWVAGGAVGGAIGSLASQGVGIAMGMQERINWKGVAIAGISGAIGGGMNWLGGTSSSATSFVQKLGTVGKILTKQGFLGGVARGVVSSAASQGIASLTNLQKDFDLVGVAAAGIAGGVASGLGLKGAMGARVSNIAGGIANVAARSLLTGTSFGDNVLAALPDIIGTTIGGEFVGVIASGGGGGSPGFSRRGAKAQLSDAKAIAAMIQEGLAVLPELTSMHSSFVSSIQGIPSLSENSPTPSGAPTISNRTKSSLGISSEVNSSFSVSDGTITSLSHGSATIKIGPGGTYMDTLERAVGARDPDTRAAYNDLLGYYPDKGEIITGVDRELDNKHQSSWLKDEQLANYAMKATYYRAMLGAIIHNNDLTGLPHLENLAVDLRREAVYNARKAHELGGDSVIDYLGYDPDKIDVNAPIVLNIPHEVPTISAYTPDMHIGQAVYNRQRDAAAAWDAGGIGWITGPIDHFMAPLTGRLDNISASINGRSGFVQPVDRENTDLVLLVAGGVAAEARGLRNLGIENGNVASNSRLAAGFLQVMKTTQAANPLVESLRTTGRLPPNFITTTQARAAGWKRGKALHNYVPDGQIGGDIYRNSNGVLPTAKGRIWYEADIGLDGTMSRSNQPGTRLLYSNDGRLFITTTHYDSVHPIGNWK